MVCSKTSKEDREKLRSEMLKAVNNFCDKVKHEEEEQVNICLEELENNFNEAALDTIFAHCENNQHTVAKALPSTSCVNEEPPRPGAGLRGQSANKQESTPLLPEQQQELRNRVRSRACPGQKPGPEWDSEPEGSPNQSPGAQQPGESFCDWIMRLFQKMLRRLKKMWQALVAWVQEKWASFVSVMKSLWIDIKDFFSSVAQYFSS